MTPAHAERQPRVVPIASTIVSASTNSTPEASSVVTMIPRSRPIMGFGVRARARAAARPNPSRASGPAYGLERSVAPRLTAPTICAHIHAAFAVLRESVAMHSATQQAELVRSGEVSARKVVESALDAIERLNPELNAFVA